MSQFHIHVDAITLSQCFEEHLVGDLGFWRSDFCGHPEGVEHFEPPHHLTKKLTSSSEFRNMFAALVSFAENHAPMRGYLEGEFLAFDEDLEDRPFDPSVKLPFRIRKTTLPAGVFRESEIHIVLDRDRSDPRLVLSLMNMGLYTAYIPKAYGTAQVFTVQGSKAKILSLVDPLKTYLGNAGGIVNGSIKEERIAAWWLSEPSLTLPPVIGEIEWFS